MHFLLKKRFLALVDVGNMPASPPPLFFQPSLSLFSSPLKLVLPRPVWHRWVNPPDVLSVCVSLLPTLLSLPFLPFVGLFCYRTDLGWGVNEAICICPKLFAVDCFEGRTTVERNMLPSPACNKTLPADPQKGLSPSKVIARR